MYSETKTILSLIVLFVLALCPIGAQADMTQPSGSGTSDDPYLIANLSNLEWFANEINTDGDTTICARLTADIDMTSTETMIGTKDRKYGGTFDGGMHTVTVNYPSSHLQGR